MDAARNLLDDFEEKANTDEQWAIINAGGVGTRFWPVGYKYKPKQLLEFAKGKGSLLQMTVERQINKRDPNSISPKKVLIITNKDIEEQVYLQVKKYDIPRENIIGEPIGLNTGPALRVGALIVEEKAGPNAIIRSLHADHIIPDSIAFNKVLAKCANFAKLSNSYVEIGVTPSKELDGKFTVNPKLGHHVIGKNIYGGIH